MNEWRSLFLASVLLLSLDFTFGVVWEFSSDSDALTWEQYNTLSLMEPEAGANNNSSASEKALASWWGPLMQDSGQWTKQVMCITC